MLSKPPLPFLGNKSVAKDKLMSIFERIDDSVDIAVDLFGGSFYLAYLFKCVHPQCQLIVNDYDDYLERLKHIDETELLRQRLLNYLGPRYSYTEKLPPESKAEVLKIIIEHERSFHYVDYLTISTYLLFSGNYANTFEELEKFAFYVRTASTPLMTWEDVKANYLNGLRIVRGDWKEVFNATCDIQDVFYLLDPPYLYTMTTGYSSFNPLYFKLSEWLDIILILRDYTSILFSSTKSGTVEIIEWLNRRVHAGIPCQVIPYKQSTINNTKNEEYFIMNV